MGLMKISLHEVVKRKLTGMNRMYEGEVIFIHPDRSFYTVEFVISGNRIRECYPFVEVKDVGVKR